MRELISTTVSAEPVLFDEPWPLERVHREIERTFDRWMRELNRGLGDFALPSFDSKIGPVAEMEDDEDEVRITAEMPGLSQDDFKVELQGNRLTIRGEKKAGREERGRGYRYAESRYGSFRRSFMLPCEVKADEARAEYKNGELRIYLPKTEEAKAKRIEVQVA